MSKCPIDHSLTDVKNKFEEQKSFLPDNINQFFNQFLATDHEQEILNEAFHLLKKYDLASAEEKNERNEKILALKSN